MLLLLLACTPEPVDGPDDTDREDSAVDTEDSGGADNSGDSGGDTGEPAVARWTVLVYLDADNNLETYAFHDMNELESGGSGDGVNVVVQIDRAEGYADGWGDWTDARRYEIVEDDDSTRVVSPVVQELGEVDMGSSQTVVDFLEWGAANYPAENYAVFFWDHGDGWYANPAPPPSIASDDESGNFLSIAEGDLHDALAPFTEAHGPVEFFGFDACYMGSWEVGHSLREQAHYMVASEAWVGGEGIFYGPMIEDMRADELDTVDIVSNMAEISVNEGNEFTYAAIDLSQMDAVADAVDALAGWGLASPAAGDSLLSLRDAARGADNAWVLWYLDLRDLGAVVEANGPADAAPLGAAVQDALDAAVVSMHGNPPFDWAGGLSIFADLNSREMVEMYAEAPGATWSQATRWDEWLLQELENENSAR